MGARSLLGVWLRRRQPLECVAKAAGIALDHLELIKRSNAGGRRVARQLLSCWRLARLIKRDSVRETRLMAGVRS